MCSGLGAKNKWRPVNMYKVGKTLDLQSTTGMGKHDNQKQGRQSGQGLTDFVGKVLSGVMLGLARMLFGFWKGTEF